MTPHEKACAALRIASHEFGGLIDGDTHELWRDARGGNEAAMWRPVWIYATRIALDIPEADLAAALTEQMIVGGFKDPKSAPFHHSSIAAQCHRVEDMMAANDGFRDEVEKSCERIIEQWCRNQKYRANLEAAVQAYYAERARERAEREEGRASQ